MEYTPTKAVCSLRGHQVSKSTRDKFNGLLVKIKHTLSDLLWILFICIKYVSSSVLLISSSISVSVFHLAQHLFHFQDTKQIL